MLNTVTDSIADAPLRAPHAFALHALYAQHASRQHWFPFHHSLAIKVPYF